MKVSKKKSIRLRNAPLKGARQIGSNMTEVEHGDLTVLYSYETPVAFLSPKGGYVTDKRWSVTPSKHIAKFFDRHGYDRKGAFKVPQEDIEMFVATGKGPQDFPINLDPTPAETQEVVRRLTRRNPSERERAIARHGLDTLYAEDDGGSYKTYTYSDGQRYFVKTFATLEGLQSWAKRHQYGIVYMDENPAGQLWYPGGVAVGRYKMGEAGVRYYVIPIESTHGWDFPTLAHMFPENLYPDGLALLEARLGYEHSGQQGYHLFKIRVGGKWSRPLRLRTSLTEIPGVK